MDVENPVVSPSTDTTSSKIKVSPALIFTLLLIIILFVGFAVYRIDINPCPDCKTITGLT